MCFLWYSASASRKKVAAVLPYGFSASMLDEVGANANRYTIRGEHYTRQ